MTDHRQKTSNEEHMTVEWKMKFKRISICCFADYFTNVAADASCNVSWQNGAASSCSNLPPLLNGTGGSSDCTSLLMRANFSRPAWVTFGRLQLPKSGKCKDTVQLTIGFTRQISYQTVLIPFYLFLI